MYYFCVLIHIASVWGQFCGRGDCFGLFIQGIWVRFTQHAKKSNQSCQTGRTSNWSQLVVERLVKSVNDDLSDNNVKVNNYK